MSSLPPYVTTVRSDPRKTPVSISDSMRRNRILTPTQCRDNRAKLQNLRNLISSTEREYRTMIADLDKLDREGRVWLVVDLIHKTSLASLDLAAGFLSLANERTGKLARAIADSTQTASDTIGIVGEIGNSGELKASHVTTAIDRVMAHTEADTVGGTYARGRYSTGMSLWNGYQNASGASAPDERNRRAVEAAVDTLATQIQSNADVIDKATEGGSPVAKRVGNVAGIVKASASYRREIEGAFNRRLEIRSGLMQSRSQLEFQTRRAIDRWRAQADEIVELLEACE
ncbi:hypothetical protein JJJ17_03320 [Paracoccus caeni]|uniref:Uncharacterized protein n=1 Tax=Paracoccus caeni TaxID=657651 RepID=A0A934VXG3_9RHOB|nr:hypothetical protein [Paracoccus caeni]MBK4214952.1 hypothetical protein [Paracoccus caeni]